MHKNYTGDFNGSFAKRPNQFLDQSLKSTIHNHINQSETQSAFSKKTNQFKRLKNADSSDDEEGGINKKD